MVSNFRRILAEIRKEANRTAPTHDLKPESVVNLVMAIVDLEDRHRVKAVHGINKNVRGMIEDATRAADTSEGG